MKARLLRELLQQEKFFVEEIDRLLFHKSAIELFADSKDLSNCNGWLFMPGEPETADWNQARILGDAQQAKTLLPLLPAEELRLLVTRNQQSLFAGFKPSTKLLWLESFPGCSNEATCGTMPAGFELAYKQKKVVRQNCTAFNPALYLLKDKQVVAFAKTARESPGFIEVYIEVVPHLRNKNLGSYLLDQMMQTVHRLGKRLLYVVEEKNGPSRKIAAKVGFRQFNSLVVLACD